MPYKPIVFSLEQKQKQTVQIQISHYITQHPIRLSTVCLYNVILILDEKKNLRMGNGQSIWLEGVKRITNFKVNNKRNERCILLCLIGCGRKKPVQTRRRR